MRNPQCGHKMKEAADKNIWRCPQEGCAQWMVEYYASPDATPQHFRNFIITLIARIGERLNDG